MLLGLPAGNLPLLMYIALFWFGPIKIAGYNRFMYLGLVTHVMAVMTHYIIARRPAQRWAPSNARCTVTVPTRYVILSHWNQPTTISGSPKYVWPQMVFWRAGMTAFCSPWQLCRFVIYSMLPPYLLTALN
jgi:hypothetical protein